MDVPMTYATATQELHPALGNLHASAGMDSNQNTHVNDGSVLMTPPLVKRKPGRPKGSGRKPHAPPPAPKIKRPVGRPRKDGLPAGSMGLRKLNGVQHGQGRRDAVTPAFNKQAPAEMSPHSMPRTSYPSSWKGGQNSFTSISGSMFTSNSVGMNKSMSSSVPIDPSLEQDDWAALARKNPIAFLNSLITNLATPYPTSSRGLSLEDTFQSHLVSLADKANQAQSSTLPALYSIMKTFWLPTSPAYFSLAASASTRKPFADHRFLYWDPQPLVFNGIACPRCTTPLLNMGRIHSGPIKIYDLEKPFFIIGCEYICQSTLCTANSSPDGSRFASTDSSILRSLPSSLNDEFPAYLLQGDSDAGSGANVWNWQAMGVSRPLWNMVRGALSTGLKREAVLHIVMSIQFGVPDEYDDEGETQTEIEERGHVRQALIQDTNSGSEGLYARNGDVQFHDHSFDAYSDALPENLAGTSSTSASDTNPNSQYRVGPSSSEEAGHSTVITPVVYPLVYGYASTPAYGNYPHVPYSYYQHSSQPTPTGTAPPSTAVSTPTTITTTISPDTPLEHNPLKRSFDSASGSTDIPSTILDSSQKRTRHCCKCGSQSCKGKGGRAFCMNACQDCGRLDCKGRNSRRPDKRCSEAWP